MVSGLLELGPHAAALVFELRRVALIGVPRPPLLPLGEIEQGGKPHPNVLTLARREPQQIAEHHVGVDQVHRFGRQGKLDQR